MSALFEQYGLKYDPMDQTPPYVLPSSIRTALSDMDGVEVFSCIKYSPVVIVRCRPGDGQKFDGIVGIVAKAENPLDLLR